MSDPISPAVGRGVLHLFCKPTPLLDGEAVVRQAKAAMAFLKADPASNGKVGAVGFCWGGGIVNIILNLSQHHDDDAR